jgi:VWFA-related protein
MSATALRILLAGAVLTACSWGPGRAATAGDPEPDPLELGLKERVEVRLVLVDFLVLDRDGRTVPDLTADDLVLLAGNREVPIHSLDRQCPLGAADDPLPGTAFPPPADSSAAPPRSIVLAFDYDHMTHVAETLDRALAMLETWPVGGEEHMVVTLGETLRVEAPFTRDRDETRRVLRRMRSDTSLYAGNFGRLTEHRFFRRMQMLFDLLERREGRKTIVLFSGPFAADGFYHDPDFKRLSALATTTRTAVYPVDTGGLRTLLDPLVRPLGGPPMLRRLANETGGRMTSDTNAITLAYARAHRDLGCTYTLGFHDPRPEPDRKRRLKILVPDRRGLRVVYPEFYVVRSREAKRRSLGRTAAAVPQWFASDQMRIDLAPLAPDDPASRRALLTVEVRPRPGVHVDEGEHWILRGLVRKPRGTVVRSFRRKVAMAPTDPATGKTPPVTVSREVRVPRGRCVVSAVLTDPDGDAPIAATAEFTVAAQAAEGGRDRR